MGDVIFQRDKLLSVSSILPLRKAEDSSVPAKYEICLSAVLLWAL